MLPEIKFTNNLGNYTFERCMLSISDQWGWSGSSVKHTKAVSISGYIKRSSFTNDPEGWDDLLVEQGTSEKGKEGSLELPWTTINKMKIKSFSVAPGTWIDFMPFTATFEDENPDDNIYTLHFFDIELHNPRLNLPTYVRRINDDYIHFQNNINSLVPFNPRNQAIRYRSGNRMFDIGLSGTMLLETPEFPMEVIEKLKMQKGSENNFAGIPVNNLPIGYPSPFPLDLAIPEIKGEFNIGNVILEKSSISWSLEEQSAQISLGMISQPQNYL